MPRGFAFESASGSIGIPVEFENRTDTGVDARLACGARVNEEASAEGVNMPLSTTPLAWAGRKPGWMPKIASNCFSKSSLNASNFSSEGRGISRLSHLPHRCEQAMAGRSLRLRFKIRVSFRVESGVNCQGRLALSASPESVRTAAI